MSDLQRRIDESRARHFGISVELARYFSAWCAWRICVPGRPAEGSADKPGIFALGYWVQERAEQHYLVLPFYYDQTENLASITLPRSDVPVFRADVIIEDALHRESILAALRTRQSLDRQRDLDIGSPFVPVRDFSPQALGSIQLPETFPLLC